MVRPSSASQPTVDHVVMNSSDEIDLLELFNTLWRRKFLIILIAALGFWGAYGLSLLKQEEWRSTAQVVAPKLSNTTELIEKNRQIQRIVDPNDDISISDLMNRVFSTFLYTAADSDEKYSYLAQTDVFKRLSMEEGANAGLILDNLSRQLSVQLPSDKQESLASSYLLSFVSDSAETSQSILTGYIAYVNRIAIETSKNEFVNNLEAMIATRKQKINDIELNLQNTRKVNIENYSDALLTAQKAGIKSSPGSLLGRSDSSNNVVLEINANPQQLYLQGEEVLTALLDVAQNTPITYPTSYYRLQYEIESLESLLDDHPEFESFSYLMRPTLPPQRQAPKRAQMAVIGGLIGGVLASLYVLMAAAFANRRRTLENTPV
ncbi:MAG: Wzz/FepE/Etk N-terminal domain-containing protein [Alcaligenaceae bacterium]|nr:Wzz/FepE/Etk N-terminal domain-containing protein [Alcaligenaceae bacterium]